MPIFLTNKFVKNLERKLKRLDKQIALDNAAKRKWNRRQIRRGCCTECNSPNVRDNGTRGAQGQVIRICMDCGWPQGIDPAKEC